MNISPTRKLKYNFANKDIMDNFDNHIPDDNHTRSQNSVPHISMTPENFHRKSTMLYGESKTGKSVIIYNIFKLLQKYIPIFVIISPTSASNGDYDDRVPGMLIYKEATQELLEKLYQRQEAAAAFYRMANRIEILQKLYERVKDPKTSIVINNMIARRYKAIRMAEQQMKGKPGAEDKIKEIGEAFEDTLRNMYRVTIRRHKRYLEIQKLSDKEKYSLKFLDFIPDMALVMDDCAADIKKWGKDPTIGKIFFQGRHNFITSIYTFQHDKLLDTTYRQNAFVSIFTTKKVVLAYFGRGTNNFESDEYDLVKEIAHRLFKNPKDHRKFVYMRESKIPFQYIKAELYPKFRVCFPSVWKYWERVKSDEEILDEDNPFMKNFMLGQKQDYS